MKIISKSGGLSDLNGVLIAVNSTLTSWKHSALPKFDSTAMTTLLNNSAKAISIHARKLLNEKFLRIMLNAQRQNY